MTKKKNITIEGCICKSFVVWCCIIATSFFWGGCNKCSKSNIERRGKAVAYERLRFGVNESDFLKESLALIPLEHPPSKGKTCRDQVSMLYPNLDEKSMTERISKGPPITTCRIRSHRLKQTSTLLEIRGEFLGGKLSRMTFTFAKSQYQSIETALKSRFGEGDSMRLTEQVIIEAKEKTYQYWTDEKEIWLLGDPNADQVVLIRQDLISGKNGLKKQMPVSQKGVPISLEDIGIGKLDLNNIPLPDLKGIGIPDSGTTSEGKAPQVENSETRP